MMEEEDRKSDLMCGTRFQEGRAGRKKIMAERSERLTLMRMLERAKIPYEALTYECDEFIDGIHSADLTRSAL